VSVLLRNRNRRKKLKGYRDLCYYPQPQAFKPFPHAVRKVRGKGWTRGRAVRFRLKHLLRCEYYPVLWLWNNPLFSIEVVGAHN
jgi:hypothetical protein